MHVNFLTQDDIILNILPKNKNFSAREKQFQRGKMKQHDSSMNLINKIIL